MGVGAGTTRVEEVGSRRHLAPAIIVLNRAGVDRPTQAEGVVGETVAMGVAHPMEVEVLVSICIFKKNRGQKFRVIAFLLFFNGDPGRYNNIIRIIETV